MVHRDPRTGQFVSSGGEPGSMEDLRGDFDTVTGSVVYTIPAADNAGGITNENIDGEESVIIDFTPVLDDDEFFHVGLLSISLSLGLPTTATAEGFGAAGWALRTDFGPADPVNEHSAFNVPGPQFEEGIIDGRQEQVEETSIIDAGGLYAQPSFNDTVTGTGGGGDTVNEHRYLAPTADLGAVLTMDEDDELTMPVDLRTENVSDHRITFAATVVAVGNEIRQE